MNEKLKRWWDALESKGFKISCTKTKYMDCNFNGDVQRDETPVKIEAQEIPQRDSFWYLGSIICTDGEIEEDVECRIIVAG